MPTRNRKTVEKEIKNRIKEINKKVDAKLSYSNLYGQIENIFSLTGEERENAITAAYIDLSKTISKNILSMSSIINSNPLLKEKYRNHEANVHFITDSTIYARDIIDQLCVLYDPENAEKYSDSPINGKQLTALRDYEISEIKGYTSYRELPKCLEKWNRDCFEEDIKELEKAFPLEKMSKSGRYNYSGNKDNPKDVTAAEYYYKARLVKEELAKHGPVWRFFNFRKVGTYNRFIQAVDEHLTSAQFYIDPSWEDERPLELLKSNVIPPHDKSEDNINKEYDLAMLSHANDMPEKSTNDMARDNQELGNSLKYTFAEAFANIRQKSQPVEPPKKSDPNKEFFKK